MSALLTGAGIAVALVLAYRLMVAALDRRPGPRRRKVVRRRRRQRLANARRRMH